MDPLWARPRARAGAARRRAVPGSPQSTASSSEALDARTSFAALGARPLLAETDAWLLDAAAQNV